MYSVFKYSLPPHFQRQTATISMGHECKQVIICLKYCLHCSIPNTKGKLKALKHTRAECRFHAYYQVVRELIFPTL